MPRSNESEDCRPSRRKLLLGAGLSVAAAAVPLTAKAQAPADSPLDEPLARPIVVYPLRDSRVTVLVAGEYDTLRLVGTLAEAPKEALRVADAQGRPREVSWNEVRAMQVNTLASEGFPEGSYRLALLSDAIDPINGAGGYTSLGGVANTASWRLMRLPGGVLKLKGKPFGELSIPLEKITSLAIEPVRGGITKMPTGAVKVEILPSVVVSVPLEEVRTFRRDLSRGTVTLTLEDDQLYAGKLVELPPATFALSTPTGPVSLPLAGIAQFDRAVPGARRL